MSEEDCYKYDGGQRLFIKSYCYSKVVDNFFKCSHCDDVTVVYDDNQKTLKIVGEHQHQIDKGWRTIAAKQWTLGKNTGRTTIENVQFEYTKDKCVDDKSGIKIKKAQGQYSIQISWPIHMLSKYLIVNCNLCDKLVLRGEEYEHRIKCHHLHQMLSAECQSRSRIKMDTAYLVHQWEKLTTNESVDFNSKTHTTLPQQRVKEESVHLKEKQHTFMVSEYRQFVLAKFEEDCKTLDPNFKMKDLYTNTHIIEYFKRYIPQRSDGRLSDLPNTKHIVGCVEWKGEMRYRFFLPDDKGQYIIPFWFCKIGGCQSPAYGPDGCLQHCSNKVGGHYVCLARLASGTTAVAVMRVDDEERLYNEMENLTKSKIKNFQIVLNLNKLDEDAIKRNTLIFMLYVMISIWNKHMKMDVVFINAEIKLHPQVALETVRLTKKAGLESMFCILDEIVTRIPALAELTKINNRIYNDILEKKYVYLYCFRNGYDIYVGEKYNLSMRTTISVGDKSLTYYERRFGSMPEKKLLLISDNDDVHEVEALAIFVAFWRMGTELYKKLEKGYKSLIPPKLINMKLLIKTTTPFETTTFRKIQECSYFLFGQPILYKFKNACEAGNPYELVMHLIDLWKNHDFYKSNKDLCHPIPEYNQIEEDDEDENSD